ncbi:hypothetical protein K431DRAFT_349900 [Polychaeton citri CBS 116435]|uniref:Uncharacterized protein n=1 Tax=Polychaeton citri CBS 116435 TaxID=1314669 RepID=A0A9P4PZK3_9PEZI|nr:hypothetical protein K431DRAFT_349900 [Polychaeton citri CBS 116435]
MASHNAVKPSDAPKSDTDLWMLYANKLRQTFLTGQDITAENRVFIPPLNAQAIMAGDTVSQEKTLSGVAVVGDSLINIDNPLYAVSGDTYTKKVLNYLYNVQLDNKADPGLKQVAEKKHKEVSKARKEFNETYTAAKEQFGEVEDPNGTFDVWASANYPELSNAQTALQGAVNAYTQIMTQINGPGWQMLAKDIAKLEGAIETTKATAYNMEVDPSLIGSATNGGEDGDSDDAPKKPKQYAPKYSIDKGFPTAVQGWIDASAQATPPSVGFSFSASEAKSFHWKDVGFSTMKVGGNASFWPFFSIDYKMKSKKQHENVHVASSNSHFAFEVSAVGMQAFRIDPDSSWNPGNVKKTYPRLFPNSAKDLLEPMVQVRYVIVGYNVTIKLTLDKATYDKITKTMETARSHDGGATATLFGFRLNIGAKAEYADGQSTSYDKLKMDAQNHTIEFPGSNNTLPILMGAVGTIISPATKH